MLTRCAFPSSSARLVSRSLTSQFHFFSTQPAVEEEEPAAAATTPATAATTPKRHTSKNKDERFRVETDQHVFDAIDILRTKMWSKMDETLEIQVHLGVDPRKPNQSIKGVAKLTHGTGKKVRVAVFATGADAAAATAAGADIVGGQDLVDMIVNGEMNFDTVIAHPSSMSLVGKVGRIIGPKGMMPSPKMGTVTVNVAEAVKVCCMCMCMCLMWYPYFLSGCFSHGCGSKMRAKSSCSSGANVAEYSRMQ
jgi:hypothetical protein